MFRAVDTLIASGLRFDNVGYRITSDGVTSDVLPKFKQRKTDRVFRVVVENYVSHTRSKIFLTEPVKSTKIKE